jgi:hypothetical protein
MVSDFLAFPFGFGFFFGIAVFFFEEGFGRCFTFSLFFCKGVFSLDTSLASFTLEGRGGVDFAAIFSVGAGATGGFGSSVFVSEGGGLSENAI